MVRRLWPGVLGAILALAIGGPAAGAEGPPAAGAGSGGGAAATSAAGLEGRWTGARLRCQKDEGKLVRCGTPSPFEITFTAKGMGSTPDENLPREFTWRWVSPTEIGITPAGGGEELKLFGIEREEDSLTFQAYVYPPTTDPSLPPESRYVHFVFDVTRAE